MATNYPDFLQVFEDLPDPRHHRTRRHRLVDILFIALCSALTGGKTFVDMEDLATVWEEWFKQFIPMTGGPPSHDTFNRVFQMIDPQRFEVCFRAWTERIRQPLGTEIIAVDGKVNRGSGGRKQSPVTLVNAWASKNRLLLGQLATEKKSNEIMAVPELLKGLMLKRRYYISSLPYAPERFAEAVRLHWGVENKVHWCLDVVFGEDQCRAKTKYASVNLSTLRKMALNIVRKEPGNKGLTRKMRNAIADPHFLITLLELDA